MEATRKHLGDALEDPRDYAEEQPRLKRFRTRF
jgi:hypothetical protein